MFMTYTSSDPSPKIVVRMGVEKKVMIARKTATPAAAAKMISKEVVLLIGMTRFENRAILTHFWIKICVFKE